MIQQSGCWVPISDADYKPNTWHEVHVTFLGKCWTIPIKCLALPWKCRRNLTSEYHQVYDTDLNIRNISIADMADHIDPSTLPKSATPVAQDVPTPTTTNPLGNVATPKVTRFVWNKCVLYADILRFPTSRRNRLSQLVLALQAPISLCQSSSNHFRWEAWNFKIASWYHQCANTLRRTESIQCGIIHIWAVSFLVGQDSPSSRQRLWLQKGELLQRTRVCGRIAK